LIGFFLFYLLAAVTIPYIPVNDASNEDKLDGCYIYILSNGVHTDLVLPLVNEMKDWRENLSFQYTKSKNPKMEYVGFGWGDKGFYLETNTWAELKPSIAFKAMFFLSASALHVTFHQKMREDELCKKIWVSKSNYEQLVSYIDNSFQQDKGYIPIPNHAYEMNDCFYEAKGTYSLFYTCNTWANNGLKAARVKACLWTPHDKAIFYHHQ
jgi:uncharacterized protein (TIGR02117 family)